MSYLPVCPHCGHQFTDEQVWHRGDGCDFPLVDQCEETFDCPSCAKTLTASYQPEPHWEFSEEDDEE